MSDTGDTPEQIDAELNQLGAEMNDSRREFLDAVTDWLKSTLPQSLEETALADPTQTMNIGDEQMRELHGELDARMGELDSLVEHKLGSKYLWIQCMDANERSLTRSSSDGLVAGTGLPVQVHFGLQDIMKTFGEVFSRHGYDYKPIVRLPNEVPDSVRNPLLEYDQQRSRFEALERNAAKFARDRWRQGRGDVRP